MRKTLVIGLGNILLGDEGLGVRAYERLCARYQLPPEIEAMDGGTLGMMLLPYLDGVTDLLLMDAVSSGAPPGTLVRLEGEELKTALALKMSMHQVGLQELLAISSIQGSLPQRIVLWGMEPALMELGLDLTEPVAAQLDALVDAVVGELRTWGIEIADCTL